jgi:hypothetical protein
MMFVATINLLMRPLINLISKMEGWDFELDRNKQVFIRSFFAGLFNTLSFILILADMLSDAPFLLWNGKPIINFTEVKASRYPSGIKEDYIAA